MSITLTADDLATMPKNTLKFFRENPTTRTFVLDWEAGAVARQAQADAELIAFAELGEWNVMGIPCTLLTLIALADSGLTIKDGDYSTVAEYPLTAVFINEVHTTLKKIQAGKKLQDIPFARTTARTSEGNFRATVEALLASL